MLFIDFDGTLADSLHVLYLAYERVAARYGFVPLKSEFDRLNGPKLEEIATLLVERHHLSISSSELLAFYEKTYEGLYEKVPPIKGAPAALEKLHDLGLRMCVVSSNHKSRIQHWLSRHHLQAYFDFIVSGDDVGASKPDPAIYRLALLQTAPIAKECCCAIEDSLNGATAAKRAGLRCIIINEHIDAHLTTGAFPYVASWSKLVSYLEHTYTAS